MSEVKELKEIQMTVSRGLVFWHDNVGAVDKRVNIVKTGDKEIRSHLIAGARPWIVVASNENASGGNVCSIVPITSNENGEANGRVQFKIKNRIQTVLVDQVQTVDAVVLKDFQYVVSEEIMELIDEALIKHFDLGKRMGEEKYRELEEKIRERDQEIERIKANVENENNTGNNDKELIIYKNKVSDLEKKIKEKTEDLANMAGAFRAKNREVEVLTESNKTKDLEIERLKKSLEEIKVKDTLGQLDIEGAVLKANKRYAQVLGAGMADGGKEITEQTKIGIDEDKDEMNPKIKKVPSRGKGSGKVSSNKPWTKAEARKFVNDCRTLGNAVTAEKYGYASDDSVYQTRKRLERKFGL